MGRICRNRSIYMIDRIQLFYKSNSKNVLTNYYYITQLPNLGEFSSENFRKTTKASSLSHNRFAKSKAFCFLSLLSLANSDKTKSIASG